MIGLTRSRGFTLVEMMIVVALIGVLVAFAYPSYQSYIQRSNRTVAKVRLLDLVEKQTRYFIDNRTYGDLSDLGFSADTVGISEEGDVDAGKGLYDLSVTTATASSYTLQALAKNQQTGDTGCTTLTITQAGLRSPQACW